MKFNKIFFILAVTLSSLLKCEHRRLIVLNEPGVNENISFSLNCPQSKSCNPIEVGAIGLTFITALHQAAAPIFVSKELWHTICDYTKVVNDFIKFDIEKLHKLYGKHKRFSKRTSIKDFKELCIYLIDFHNKSNSLIKTYNTQEKLNKISEKNQFFDLKNAPRSIQNKDVNLMQEVWTYVLCFNVPIEKFSIKDYDNCYVFIPKKYLNNLIASHKNEKQNIDITLGLKISKLKSIENSFNYKPYTKKKNSSFEKSLLNIFVKNLPYKWTLCIAGHGCFYQESHKNLKLQKICYFSINEWQYLLKNLQKSISMHFLFYISCSSGGQNSIDGYQVQNEQIKFNFPIASVSLTDSEIDIQQKIPISIYKNKFVIFRFPKLKDIKNIEPETHMNFPTFFSKCEKAIKATDYEDCLNHMSIWLQKPEHGSNNRNFLSNIPTIRLPGETKFNPIKLVKNLFNFDKKLSEKNIKINPSKQFACLLKTQDINKTIEIKNTDANFPSFVSMVPGRANHNIKNINASNYKFSEIIEAFLPFENLHSTKIVFIQSITAINDILSQKENSNISNIFFLNNITDTDDSQINAVIFSDGKKYYLSTWDFESSFPKNITETFEPIKFEELKDLFDKNNLKIKTFIK